MDLQHKLNPVADAEPIDNAGELAEQKTDPGTGFPSEGVWLGEEGDTACFFGGYMVSSE